MVVAFTVRVNVTTPAVRRRICSLMSSGIDNVDVTINANVSPRAPLRPPQLRIMASLIESPYPLRFIIG